MLLAALQMITKAHVKLTLSPGCVKVCAQ